MYPQSISPSVQEETGKLSLPVRARGEQSGLMNTSPVHATQIVALLSLKIYRDLGVILSVSVSFILECLEYLVFFIQIFSQAVCGCSSLKVDFA